MLTPNIEVIEYTTLKNLNVFMIDIYYRTPHLHPEIEILYVIKGTPRFIINQKEHHFQPGDIILLNSNDLHEITSNEGLSTFLCIQLSPAYFKGYFPDIKNILFTHYCYFNGDHEKLTYTLLNLLKLYYEKEPFYEINCASMVNIITFYLLKHFAHYEHSALEQQPLYKDRIRLNRILHYIEENHQRKFSLPELAAQENLSVYFLSHFIKKHLNQSFQEYLMFVRFRHAKELILSTNMSLTDICFEAGFSDYRYMTQAFKKHCQCTPKTFKKQSYILKNTTPSSSSEKIYSTKEVLDFIAHYKPFRL